MHDLPDHRPGRGAEGSDEVVRAADVVVTMGCGVACPIYPGKRYQDWLLDEPEGASIGHPALKPKG